MGKVTSVGLAARERKTSAQRATNDTTRDKILDAAEYLFGEGTFDTVSLREITGKANVTLALASYHFGTKEHLFSEIIRRRADILNDMRRARLASLEAEGPLSTESVIEAFMHPLFQQMTNGAEGWQSYLFILGKLGQTNRWLDLLHVNFDATAELFLSRLQTTLPDVPYPELARGFCLALSSMLQVLSKNRRIDALSQGELTADDLYETYKVLIKFVVKGLEGLADFK